MEGFRRFSLALIIFSLFSISYLVTSVSAQSGNSMMGGNSMQGGNSMDPSSSMIGGN
jgi:hypothetical protein